MRRSLCLLAALALVAFGGGDGHAQGTGTIDSRALALMLSTLGASGQLFDVDHELTGFPQSPTQVRPDMPLVVAPGQFVLVFLRNEVQAGRLPAVAMLTEDGQWGAVPLQEERGRRGRTNLFLDEASLEHIYQTYRDDETAEWVVVTNDFDSVDARVMFTRGEVLRLATDEAGEQRVVVDPSIASMRSKVQDIRGVRGLPAGVVEDHGGRLSVRVGHNHTGHVEVLDMGPIVAHVGSMRALRGGWGQNFFAQWPKTIVASRGIRVDCDMVQQWKDSTVTSASAELSVGFNLGNIVPALDRLGITLGMQVAARAEREFTGTVTREITKRSYDIDVYVIQTSRGPELVSLGRAQECEADEATGSRARFPYGIAPGVPGAAIDRSLAEEIDRATDLRLNWNRGSGFLESACGSGGVGAAASFFARQRGIDMRVARFAAAQFVRVSDTSADCPGS